MFILSKNSIFIESSKGINNLTAMWFRCCILTVMVSSVFMSVMYFICVLSFSVLFSCSLLSSENNRRRQWWTKSRQIKQDQRYSCSSLWIDQLFVVAIAKSPTFQLHYSRYCLCTSHLDNSQLVVLYYPLRDVSFSVENKKLVFKLQ